MADKNLDRLKKFSGTELIRESQQQLVRRILRAVSLVGLLAVLAGTFDSYAGGDFWTIPVYWGAYLFAVVLTLWRNAPHGLRVWAILSLIYVMAVVDFVQDGIGGSGRAFVVVLPFIAGLFFSRRVSLWVLLAGTLTMGGFGAAYLTGVMTLPSDPNVADAGRWIAGTVVVLMLGALEVASLGFLVPHLSNALMESSQLAADLEAERLGLEAQVQERTAELAQRQVQLETATQVARDAAQIQDLEHLLQETTRLISERFAFYHTGIFLLDQAGEFAILRAASSPGGARMLERGHRLRVGQVGIVGYVTEMGEPRIALDVGEDAVFFDNPDLPETHSEMALPLRARGVIIGALDVQSKEPNAFDRQDQVVLQTLADQIAVAISNTRLYQQAQESLEAERRAYGELSREAWRQLIRSHPSLSRRYDPEGILPAASEMRQEVQLAVQRGETIQGQAGQARTCAIPLRLHGQVIGVIDAHKSSERGEWLPGELDLLQALAEQLSQALDSARLYQETQLRATRERLTGEIAANLRRSLDVESVLRTAAQEVRQALDLPELVVRLVPETAVGDDSDRQVSSPGTLD